MMETISWMYAENMWVVFWQIWQSWHNLTKVQNFCLTMLKFFFWVIRLFCQS